MSENDLWTKSDDEPRIPSTSIVSDAELGLDEEPPELEATELELAWYRAVARNMRFYGRQWFLALACTGLGMSAFASLPKVSKYGGLVWNDVDLIIICGILLPAVMSGLGYWAYRAALFPANIPKRKFTGVYDVTATRSGHRSWIDYNVLLIPFSVRKSLRRGHTYSGEGFFVSKGGDDWLVPTAIGEWAVSTRDTPERLSRAAGWLIFSSFQITWVGVFESRMGDVGSTDLISRIFFYLFILSCIAYGIVNMALLGILLFRFFGRKPPELSNKD